MSEIIQLIIDNYELAKRGFIILITAIICLLSTSCACAGLSCSIGGVETHKALNDRMVIMKSTRVVGGQNSWEK